MRFYLITQLKCLLVSTLVVFSFYPVFSQYQEFYFNQISTKEGLSHNRVHDIIQDSEGFLWIGTADGLNRYDGIKFTKYYKDDLDINSSFIVSLCEDTNGNIWIGTDNGITVYDKKLDCFRKFKKQSNCGTDIRNKVPSIQLDEQGNVWMAVNSQGLFSYNSQTGELRNYFVVDGVQTLQSDITTFYFDQNNTCWLGLYFDNLYFANKELSNITPYSISDGTQPFLRDNVNRINRSPYNNVYIATVNQGVCEVNLNLNTITSILPNTGDNFIANDLYFESNRNLWIGTSNGLYKFDLTTEDLRHFESDPSDPFSISDSEVLSVVADDLHGIWVGTYSRGMNHANSTYTNFKLVYNLSESSLVGSLIRGFSEDEDGNIWIGTEKSGLFKYFPDDNLLQKYNNPAIPENIFGLCYHNKNLWMGSYSGIYKLNIQTGILKVYDRKDPESSLRDNKIFKIYKNSLDQLLFGTTLGLLRYDDKIDDLVQIDEFNGIFVNDIMEDKAGNMWFSSYADGLFKYDMIIDSIVNYRYDPHDANSIPCNKILSLFEDQDNNIWACTQGAGFCRLNQDKSFTVFDVSRGMPNNIIYMILEDDKGNLWVSSNKGLIQFDPESEDIKVYTVVDGLLNNEFNYNSGIKTSSGEILFGSADGFIRFKPESFVENRNVPNIVLSDLIINERPVKANQPDSPLTCAMSDTRKLELAANQNNIQIRFSILNYQSPSNNSLHFLLEGSDKDWESISPENNLTFNGLRPGKYILKLKGKSGVGVWNESYPDIEIIILPKFYQSKYAIIVYILFAMILTLVSIYYSRKRTEAKQLARQKAFERNREIELYNEKIDFFSSVAHEIKTPLTLIRTPLEHIISEGDFEEEIESDLNLINHNTQHLSQLIRELLDFSKIEKKGFQLSKVEFDLLDKIRFLKYNFDATITEKDLRFEIFAEEEQIFILADEQGMVKILNNIISNAIKYAKSYIEIRAVVEKDIVRVSFKNDGNIIPLDRREEIFHPFMQYRDPQNIYMNGFGIGLSLARKLVELHAGILEIDDDLSCNNFILTLPLHPVSKEDAEESEHAKTLIERDLEESEEPVILVVEDKRELLDYMKDKLAKKYSVFSAANGELAREVLDKEQVDVILTDIAMPVMDGFELCKLVKSNFETSHIPVIIISAYSSPQYKIESMESGADVYIEKPFSMKYLFSCIDGQLNIREKLKKVYNSELRPSHEKGSLSKRDQEFLNELDDHVLSNISEADLSIEELAEHLCLSKSTLNRKIKGLLQITPNEYIRKKRLIMAAKLLDEGSYNINEVCYMVGFNTPSYFIKCFKSFYGQTPNEYEGGAPVIEE